MVTGVTTIDITASPKGIYSPVNKSNLSLVIQCVAMNAVQIIALTNNVYFNVTKRVPLCNFISVPSFCPPNHKANGKEMSSPSRAMLLVDKKAKVKRPSPVTSDGKRIPSPTARMPVGKPIVKDVQAPIFSSLFMRVIQVCLRTTAMFMTAWFSKRVTIPRC